MMWGKLSKRWQIVAASVFSFLLVCGAYLLAHSDYGSQIAQASTETALLQAIATKDSDSDGLPDWEEALYGTNPQVADSRNLGMNDGEAVAKGLIVPLADDQLQKLADASSTASSFDYKAEGLPEPTTGTITDGFAKTFFTLYVAAKNQNGGTELSADQVDAVATQAINQLSSTLSPAPDFKAVDDLTVSGSGAEAMRTFASEAQDVLVKNLTDATKSDLEYFQDAINTNDTDAITHLTALSKSYLDTAAGLAALSVPKEVSEQDLAIINAIRRIGQIYGDFSRVGTDPLTAMLALQQYKDAELAAENAFTALASVYAAQGVVFSPGAPGWVFVNLMTNLTALQATTQTP